MADGIALNDKFQTNSRFFIVHEIIMKPTQLHGIITTIPSEVGLLDLNSRVVTLIPIDVVLKEIENGNMWRWSVEYTFYKKPVTNGK